MPDSLKLTFLGIHRFENGEVVRGAFLTTDEHTKPAEFRCTNPIRPTALQKVLYGGILDKHIMLELISKPLISSARVKPSIILVRDPNLLELRTYIEHPVLYLYKNDEVQSSNKGDESNQMITSSSGKFEPIIVSAHKKFKEELNQSRLLLTEVFHGHDLLEPFERVRIALDQVHKQKPGE